MNKIQKNVFDTIEKSYSESNCELVSMCIAQMMLEYDEPIQGQSFGTKKSMRYPFSTEKSTLLRIETSF